VVSGDGSCTLALTSDWWLLNATQLKSGPADMGEEGKGFHNLLSQKFRTHPKDFVIFDLLLS
jgi:hypothetical protein